MIFMREQFRVWFQRVLPPFFQSKTEFWRWNVALLRLMEVE